MSTMKLGDLVLEVTNPRDVQPVSADVSTEIRAFHGIFCLSFAAVIVDGDGKPHAEITSRIRLNTNGAIDLRNALDDLLKGITPPKEQLN